CTQHLTRSLHDALPISDSLANHRGKALLIVNVASKCGLTPQYTGLEALYESKRDQGLEVLGFPANNFKGQEPGSDEEIQSFCSKIGRDTSELQSRENLV